MDIRMLTMGASETHKLPHLLFDDSPTVAGVDVKTWLGCDPIDKTHDRQALTQLYIGRLAIELVDDKGGEVSKRMMFVRDL